MSQWRRKASEELPELQRLIASKDVDSPMMLWVELNQKFEKICEIEPQPLDLLKRFWRYCEWCLKHGNQDVQTAAAVGFCEHLLDSPKRAEVIPRIMGRSYFLGLRQLLEYHNSPEQVDVYLNVLWK